MQLSAWNNIVGLSILIPIYNYNVTTLVQVLNDQLNHSKRQGEIVLLDDGSSLSFVSNNEILQNGSTIRFITSGVNEGRIIARQKLAAEARYENLLFLDCDSEVIKKDFLSAYFNLIDKDTMLASGGRVYVNEEPKECDLKLHWKYGSKRESKASAFRSNNFLIKKDLFSSLETKIPFSGYGHEDSWWGIQFEEAGVKCEYINNPTLHAGLEKASLFIEKSENAVGNLLVLEKMISEQTLSRHIKIYKWYRRIKNSGLAGAYLFFENCFHKFFYKNLISCNPNLFYFDCYRLAILLKKGKNN
ncbi:hypothetical protein CAP36_15500 [Chitinophagaceae bacterium IBVUCB2]|nr:hypothetical protein CAP36_15500 [Chitinophagaceae bacterium IBVUCB2]